MKREITTLLALLAFTGMVAQTYSGKLTDTSGKPLASASVLLVNANGSNIKFTKTDKQGNFSIAVPEGKTATHIAFVCLGYARQDIATDKFGQNGQTFKMKEQVQEIKEVEVKPEAFHIKGDTISYSVVGLREKQDRTIEDVISRVPGIRVTTSGTILYRDKAINKFYVDGKDMAGGNYAMVSRNLSADKVDSVQVLENHQPVNALRGKTFSDAAALNLVLKEGAKMHWTGTAELGTGAALQKPWAWNRKVRLVEMYLGNRMQSISMYKHNNVAEDMMSEVNGQAYSPDSETGDLCAICPVGTGRYGFNNSHLLATNWYAKAGENTNLRMQATYFYDKSTHHNYAERTYFDIGNGQTMTEERNAYGYTSQMAATINYIYNANHTFVSNTLTGQMVLDHSDAHTVLNGSDKYEKVKPHRRSISDEVAVVISPGNGSHNIRSNVQYAYLPGTLRLYNGTDETLNMKSLQWNTSYDYYRKISRLLQLGMTANYNMARKSKFVAYNDTMSTVRYNEDKVMLSPSVTIGDMQSSSITFELDASWLSRHLGDDTDCRWILEPYVNFLWKMTGLWSLHTNYRHTFSLSGFEENNMRIYTSYNNATSGTGKNNHSAGDNADIRLSFQEPGFGWGTTVGYTFNTSRYNTLYESTLNEGVYIRESMDEENTTVNNTLRFNLSRSFRHMRTRITIGNDYSWSHYDILLNHAKTRSMMRNYNAFVMLKMRPCKIFNFDERSTFALSRQESAGRKTSTRHFFHTLNLYLVPGNWQLAMKNECRHSPDGSEKFSFYSTMKLAYKTQHYDLAVNCNNLWGTNKREYRSITTLGTSYSVTELRPREVLASVVFNL